MYPDLFYAPYRATIRFGVTFKDIGLQFLIIFFFYKIYSLCKNNAISKVFNKLQVIHFRCTVHTNTTPTVITHSCVLQKPPSCNDNGYKFET